MQPIQNQPYNTVPDKPARNRAGTVWAYPVSLAATQGVEISFLSSGYLDVSVRPLTFNQPIYSAGDDQTLLWPGCPIRKSMVRCLLAAPHGLSQLATSFIGFWCQGIHRVLLVS